MVVSGPDGHLGRETFADEGADVGRAEQGVRALEGVEVFAQLWPAAPRMIIVGADGLAGALTDQARLLGYAVTVCDPRPVFATAERFPTAEVVRAWPDRHLGGEAAAGRCDDRTVVCVLTHDARVDVPTIRVALGLPALVFVGATGSGPAVPTVSGGCSPRAAAADLARLRTPLGSGSRGPATGGGSGQHLAEILAERHARRGERLRTISGPLHGPPGP